MPILKLKEGVNSTYCERNHVGWRLNLLATSKKMPLIFTCSGSTQITCRLLCGPHVQSDSDPKLPGEKEKKIARISRGDFPLTLTCPKRLIVHNGQITGYPDNTPDFPRFGHFSIPIINNLRVQSVLGGKGEVLLAATDTGSLLVFDLDNLQREPAEYKTALSAWGIACHPTRNVFALGTNAHRIYLFYGPYAIRNADREKLQRWTFESTETNAKPGLAERHEYSYLAFSGIEHAPIFPTPTDAHDDNLILCQRVHEHNVPHVSFSPCGKHVISCSIDGSVAVFDLETKLVQVHKFPLAFYQSSYYKRNTDWDIWDKLERSISALPFLWNCAVISTAQFSTEKAAADGPDDSFVTAKEANSDGASDSEICSEYLLVAGFQDVLLIRKHKPTVIESMLFQPLTTLSTSELTRISFLEYIADMRLAIVANSEGRVGLVYIARCDETVSETKRVFPSEIGQYVSRKRRRSQSKSSLSSASTSNSSNSSSSSSDEIDDSVSFEESDQLLAELTKVQELPKEPQTILQDLEVSNYISVVDGIKVTKRPFLYLDFWDAIEPVHDALLVGLAVKQWNNSTLFAPSLAHSPQNPNSNRMEASQVYYMYLYYDTGLVRSFTL